MSGAFPSSFYKKPFIFGSPKAVFGPFYSDTSAALNLNLARPLLASQGATTHGSQAVRNRFLFDGLRAVRFPGVLQVEKPATTEFPLPAAAAITDHSTMTIDDGSGIPIVYEWKKIGAITPGNVEVDISAATTPTTVATALLTAMNAATAALASPPSGFIARYSGPGAGRDGLTPTGRLAVTQCAALKNQGGTAKVVKLCWLSKTWGSLGNGPVTLSNPADWAGVGAPPAMAGGKFRRPGVVAIAGDAPGKRLLSLPGYYPFIKQEL